MMVLPLSMPCCTSWNQAFLSETSCRERHCSSATFSAGKYDDDISNVCSSRTEHIATATKSLAQTFVICDNRAQRFIPPGVMVMPDQWGDGRSCAQWENKTHVWRKISDASGRGKPSSRAAELYVRREQTASVPHNFGGARVNSSLTRPDMNADYRNHLIASTVYKPNLSKTMFTVSLSRTSICTHRAHLRNNVIS